MNPLTFIFQKVLYQPFLNILVVFYNLPMIDFGLAIILLTILVKAATWRLDTHAILKQREAQIKGAEVQEEMKELQEKYKDDPMKQSEEIRKLWKEKKFNPFSSFAPMIVQIVILIALFQILRTNIGPEQLKLLYPFVKNPGEINPMFLGIINLAKASPVLAVLTGVVQFIYSKLTFSMQKKYKPKTKKKDKKKKEGTFQKVMQNQMIYFLPIFTVIICLTLPAALPLYWSLSTAVGILQTKIVYRKIEAENK
ncbi:MAG: YidC/Oxa1 family membrane protein insertase [Candidatus Pacebacteria bacterium]|nr:YidC/Oxa1 family membrane protein insertase [Candidatus Paceibacterota bacterium]